MEGDELNGLYSNVSKSFNIYADYESDFLNE